MNIVLIGFRGVGKSTIGKILSKKTGMKFISTDDEIENTYGKISEIVKNKGWGYFREIEKKIVKKNENIDNAIIATGGGTVMDKENVKILKKNGKFFLLTATKEEIAKRIKDSNRPPLTSGENEIEKILNERMPVYLSIADYVIDTTEKTPEYVAEEIKKIMDKILSKI